VSPPGRLLASNCFQCHGTNGRGPGFERLAGESADEIYDELRECGKASFARDPTCVRFREMEEARRSALAQ
ncbi:c-type cytochrome, partial [Hydrogenophaga aromaticivorans]|uniref:c-type cytochrome n=1 Tax=Hydrogenophaga aromaticivorans TaxID=2610898 RepID=UPI003CCCBB2F